MVALFDPQAVIERLRAQSQLLLTVAGAAEFAVAKPDLKRMPAAYVIPLAERALNNDAATLVVRQQVQARFAVIMATRNLRDARGEAAQTVLLPVRAEIITLLLGWSPQADFDPCTYASGTLRQIDDSVLWWQDEFVTSTQLRSL